MDDTPIISSTISFQRHLPSRGIITFDVSTDMKNSARTGPEPKFSRRVYMRSLRLSDIKSRLLYLLWVISAIVFILPVLLFLAMSDGNPGGLLLLPMVFGPMMASLFLGAAVESCRSLVTLLISNILYFGFFLWVYFNALYLHPDPQAGIAFLFVGIYSLPVMIPLWVIAICLRRPKNTRSESGPRG